MSALDSRVTGRRLGRIIGELDDIVMRIEAMHVTEATLGNDDTKLNQLAVAVAAAHTMADRLVVDVNARQSSTRQ